MVERHLLGNQNKKCSKSKGTYPAGCREVVYPNEVVLQLAQLLEVLQADETVLQLSRHFGDLPERICRETAPRVRAQSEPPANVPAEPQPGGTARARDRAVQLGGTFGQHPAPAW